MIAAEAFMDNAGSVGSRTGQLNPRLTFARMFPQADLGMMLAQQFVPQDIPIFGDNTNQSIGVFGVIAHQLGQGAHLPFEAIKPPNDVLRNARRRLAGRKTHHASRFSDGGLFRHSLPSLVS